MKFLAIYEDGEIGTVEADNIREAVNDLTWKYLENIISITKMPEEEQS